MTRSIGRLKGIATSTLLALSVLTAGKGINNFCGHKESWYNLRMNKVVQRADQYYGLQNVYKIRTDGVKTYNGFVICAGNYEVHPYGSIVDTSLGTGIILDHIGKETDKTVIDIATDW
ncbi:MAG: hypothetical protein IJL90_00230 [Lachnospiraceae bacterium]|nr:hypothetical protein [Lachnospiraceae bacterium]